MFEKIKFLYKSHASIFIILLFLFQKILNLFLKKKIKLHKKYFLNLISNQKISSEFFSVNAYNFFIYLSSLPKNFRYLEIGSFEGGSAIFVASKFKEAEIYCVDNWIKTEDGYSNLNFEDIELNFDYNTQIYKNIYKIKKSSDDFFTTNKLTYDVIYIDGYHKAEQVFKDCVNSWKNLNINGILICDDYIWDHYNDIKNNPCYAINKFLRTIKNYKILKVSNSQIFLKKT
jgi:predicted O-methyltransferase YrrM